MVSQQFRVAEHLRQPRDLPILPVWGSAGRTIPRSVTERRLIPAMLELLASTSAFATASTTGGHLRAPAVTAGDR